VDLPEVKGERSQKDAFGLQDKKALGKRNWFEGIVNRGMQIHRVGGGVSAID